MINLEQSSTFAGIKDKNNVYRAVSQGYIDVYQFDTQQKVRGMHEYDIADYAYTSEHVNPLAIADNLINEDLEVLSGKSLFVFDSLIIHDKLVFALGHKTPHIEHNRITGTLFQAIFFPNISKQMVKQYLSNPDIIVSSHTHKHLDIFNLAPSRKYALSKRELECVTLLVKGASANDIAHTLNLSKRTVDFYIRNVKDKLNVNKSTEIVATAISEGIV